MNYNDYIKTTLPDYLTSLLSLVDKFSEDKITKIKIEVEEPDATITDCLTYEISYSYKVKISYEVNKEQDEIELFIPKLYELNYFIINGKLKSINITLSESQYMLKTDYAFVIRWGFKYIIDKNVYRIYDGENEMEYTYNELPKEYLKLTPDEGKKLKIMYNLPEVPKTITPKISGLFKIDPRNDSIVLHKYPTTIIDIMTNVFKTNKLTLVKQLQDNFYKNGNISATKLQSAINKCYYGTNDLEITAINNYSNINPISIRSMTTRVIIPEFDTNILLSRDSLLFDLLDPVATSDNASVNKLNYLNKCVSINGNKFEINCYNKRFNPIKLDYLDYLASNVLCSSNVNYKTKTLLNLDKYVVRINGNKVEVPADELKYDYIEKAPDDGLSLLTRMIPMINSSDSIRVSMASKFVSQAVPIINNEKPLVSSGYEGDLITNSDSIQFMENAGTVVEVTPSKIVIDTTSGRRNYELTRFITGIYNITTYYSVLVNKGDKLKYGDIIAAQFINKNKNVNLGINALTAFMPYRGYNFEDGVVISESFAKKLAHYEIRDYTYQFRQDSIIKNIVPIGMKIKTGDKLITYLEGIHDEDLSGLSELLRNTSKFDKVYKVENNIEDGYVLDIKFDYAGRKNSPKYKVLNNINKTNLPPEVPLELRDNTITEELDLEHYDTIIKIRILNFNHAKNGNKLSNRFGSKGLSSIIVPDKDMLRTEDGRIIDVVLNTDAVIARKNISQLPELYLTLIAQKILTISKRDGVAVFKKLCNKYMLNNYLTYTDKQLESLLPKLKNLYYETGCYSKINLELIEDWLDELEIDPKIKLIDGKTNRPIRNKIVVGYMYFMKLYQLPEYTAKVYNQSGKDPIMGVGFQRPTGMKLGEMETNAMLASDTPEIITSSSNKQELLERSRALDINLRLSGIKLDEL